MNYADLQVVIKEVCGKTNCPGCKQSYDSEDIHIVGTTRNEGIFMAKCTKCETNVVINVSVTRKSESNIKPHKRDWKPNLVSSDEVLDMHNFLDSYEGDIASLFAK